MSNKSFKPFRLVGGTALSLYRGHRISVDIDLFTDEVYNTVDFKTLEDALKKNFEYVDFSEDDLIGMGKSYFVGASKEECIKLDIYYTEPFINGANQIDNIRLASVEDIIAMKMEVVMNGGRQKDFWDLHELLDEHPYREMVQLHKTRYPYSHDAKKLEKAFTEFSIADSDFEPIGLKGQVWELIKLDLIEFVEKK